MRGGKPLAEIQNCSKPELLKAYQMVLTTLEYSAVFWIEAGTEEQIVASLLRVASVFQVPGREDQDQQRVIAAVQRWLSIHRQWLLIWDNVEDLDLLPRFLPSTRSGAILNHHASPGAGHTRAGS